MLHLAQTLVDRPVLSLRTGGPVAMTTGVIVNPNNLKIEGWYCQDRLSKQQLILQNQDVREVLAQGLVVDDHDVLSEPADLVRLQPILNLHFELIGKPVITTKKQKVGKVTDFAADTPTFYIQKLYVAQSLLKSFSGGSLSIDRTQIVEITNSKIVIQDLPKTQKASVVVTSPVAGT